MEISQCISNAGCAIQRREYFVYILLPEQCERRSIKLLYNGRPDRKRLRGSLNHSRTVCWNASRNLILRQRSNAHRTMILILETGSTIQGRPARSS